MTFLFHFTWLPKRAVKNNTWLTWLTGLGHVPGLHVIENNGNLCDKFESCDWRQNESFMNYQSRDHQSCPPLDHQFLDEWSFQPLDHPPRHHHQSPDHALDWSFDQSHCAEPLDWWSGLWNDWLDEEPDAIICRSSSDSGDKNASRPDCSLPQSVKATWPETFDYLFDCNSNPPHHTSHMTKELTAVVNHSSWLSLRCWLFLVLVSIRHLRMLLQTVTNSKKTICTFMNPRQYEAFKAQNLGLVESVQHCKRPHQVLRDANIAQVLQPELWRLWWIPHDLLIELTWSWIRLLTTTFDVHLHLNFSKETWQGPACLPVTLSATQQVAQRHLTKLDLTEDHLTQDMP